jgi:hypothetical protein
VLAAQYSSLIVHGIFLLLVSAGIVTSNLSRSWREAYHKEDDGGRRGIPERERTDKFDWLVQSSTFSFLIRERDFVLGVGSPLSPAVRPAVAGDL